MPIRFFTSGFYLLGILFLAWFGGCATQTEPPVERPKSDLKDVAVNSFNKFEGRLYAATDEGLYRKEKSDTSWVSLGLIQKEVIDVVFLPGQKLLAAVRIADFGSNIPSLFLSADKGRSWQPYMNNYGGETDVTWVGSIAATSQPSDTLFARGGGLMVARSTSGGKNWKLTNGEYWDLWGGHAILMETDPHFQKRVWAGGSDPYGLAYLLKSTDAGESWYNCNVGSSISYDVLSFPQNKDLIIAAVSGLIRKSTDGCKTWKTVSENIDPHTLTHSARNPETIYASGISQSGTLFFSVSKDFGDTWELIEIKNQTAQLIVNDMLSVIENGNEVLYFGTNKGVYNYRFEN